MSEPTKADLAAAVTRLTEQSARLTQESAGLRDLLAAVSAYAEVPHPASYADSSHAYEYELERRLDAIAIYASGGRKGMDPGVYVLVIQDRAKHLREEAARPVRYEVRAEPAPAEHPFDAGEGSRELSGPGRDLLREAIAEQDAASVTA